MAQVKPGILKDIPVPKVSISKQAPFIELVNYLMYLNDSKSQDLLSHTNNERIAANIEEVLNMMVFEVYFKEHLIENGLDVIQFVNKSLSQMNGKAINEAILEFYMWLQQTDNEVRNRLIAANIKSPDLIANINSFSISVS